MAEIGTPCVAALRTSLQLRRCHAQNCGMDNEEQQRGPVMMTFRPVRVTLASEIARDRSCALAANQIKRRRYSPSKPACRNAPTRSSPVAPGRPRPERAEGRPVPICTLPRGCLKAPEPRGDCSDVRCRAELPELRVRACFVDAPSEVMPIGARRDDVRSSGLVASEDGFDEV